MFGATFFLALSAKRQKGFVFVYICVCVLCVVLCSPLISCLVLIIPFSQGHRAFSDFSARRGMKRPKGMEKVELKVKPAAYLLSPSRALLTRTKHCTPQYIILYRDCLFSFFPTLLLFVLLLGGGGGSHTTQKP